VQVGLQPAAFRRLVPDVQPDHGAGLGPGGFQPHPDVPGPGRTLAQRTQHPFGGIPVRRGHGVTRREQPPAQQRQRCQRVVGGHRQQAERHVTPGEAADGAAGELSDPASFEFHDSQRTTPGRRP
jgi:hypothetical protein